MSPVQWDTVENFVISDRLTNKVFTMFPESGDAIESNMNSLESWQGFVGTSWCLNSMFSNVIVIRLGPFRSFPRNQRFPPEIEPNYGLVYIQLDRQSCVNVRKAIDFRWDEDCDVEERGERALRVTFPIQWFRNKLPKFLHKLCFIDRASNVVNSKTTWQWQRKVKKDISIFVSFFLSSSPVSFSWIMYDETHYGFRNIISSLYEIEREYD